MRMSEVVIDQANRCSNIIKGLLGFARATTAEKSPTNINDVLGSSLNIVRNKADFFNISLVTSFDPSLAKVKADAPQVAAGISQHDCQCCRRMRRQRNDHHTTRNMKENDQTWWR